MENSYLIQRLEKPTNHPNPFCFGGGGSGLNKEALQSLSQVFAFDYMGRAEFEFGAICEPLSFLNNNAKKLVLFPLEVKKKTVYVLCLKKDREEVSSRIVSLAYDKVRLCEPSLLPEVLEGKNTRILGWIDYSGFFFSVDKEMAEKFHELLRSKS